MCCFVHADSQTLQGEEGIRPVREPPQLQRGRKETNLKIEFAERVVEPDNPRHNPSKSGGEHQNLLCIFFILKTGDLK